MKRRIFTAAILALMLLQVFGGARPALAYTSYCDAAAFVADVTVPDGSVFAANATFTKTWRLKNVGTCTWNTSYSLVFVQGSQMGGPASVAFTQSVAPGQTVDLSVNLTAPASNGQYQGYWALKNASGTVFGIGVYANQPFWVLINVGSGGGGVGYDFAANMCSATWSSGAGSLPCPGTDGNASGFELQISNPQLENGSNSSSPGLLTVPQNIAQGYIQGIYPAYTVQSGDRFQSIVNCQYGASGCNVYFQLAYQVGSGSVITYWQFHEKYEGLYYSANVDLSPLAGQSVKFILRVVTYDSATNNRALWVGPKIASGGGTPPPPPPPPSSSCDKAAFVADVTVPDYTVFAPNTAFTKTWRLKNVGTCTWTTSYKLVWVSGSPIGATYPVALATSVAPGQTVDVSANMVAPSTAGTYQGNWMLQNASGTNFGIGSAGTSQFWVLIRVSGTPPPPSSSCDKAAFVADVTVPDYTVFAPNTAFTKTWRLKNVGTCTWTTSYKLVWVSGSPIGAVYPVAFPTSVAPGATVDLSANMAAPATAGTYQGNWMLQNASGTNFGIGASGTSYFWVLIQVSGSGPVATSTPTNTPIPGTTPGASADLVVTMTDGASTYIPGSVVYYTIVVSNNGPNNVNGAIFSLDAPHAASSYSVSCVADPGAFCGAGPYGLSSGAVYTDTINVPVAGKVTYSQTVYIPSNITTNLTNVASASNPAGISDPNVANSTATDTNSAAPKADLVLIGNVSSTTYHPGDQITYVFTVTNNGPSDVVGATFGGSVSMPNITSWVLNCSPNAGTTCTATQSGTSSTYSDTISIPAGYSLAYTLIVTTSLSASGAATDTTTVTVPAGTTDPNTGNNTLTFSANQ